MPSTGSLPNSSVVAYASGDDMVAARAWTQLADLLVDPTTRTGTVTPPNSSAAVITTFTTVDGLGYRALRWASAQIEAAVTAGQRYKPEDLQTLAQLQIIPIAQGGDGSTTAFMVGRDLLVGLCCDLAFWWLTKRRKPGVRPEQVSGVYDALAMLDALARGERIFPFTETQAAGLPEVAVLDRETDISQASEPLSVVASRMFGHRNR